MRVLSVIILLTALILPPVAFAEVQTLTATHTYVMGDNDSRNDARQWCLLEAKRKILEQAGVYIESASEVKNFDLKKDNITSFAAAVMQVKDTKEEVSFQQGHMTMTLTLKADVDLAEVRKQMAARQVDAGVRDDVAAQKERLKRLEAQLEAMQREQQDGKAPGRAPASLTSDLSAAELKSLHTQATKGDVEAQFVLGVLHDKGVRGVPQDYPLARQWYEKAAAQGDARAKYCLGMLYVFGKGVKSDELQARRWIEQAAAQGYAMAKVSLGSVYRHGSGVPQDYIKARQWYTEAAAQGDVDGAWILGAMYANGEGIQQNYVRAYMWRKIAEGHAKGTEQEAITEKLREFMSKMTPVQIAEGQRLASRCQAQQFKGC